MAMPNAGGAKVGSQASPTPCLLHPAAEATSGTMDAAPAPHGPPFLPTVFPLAGLRPPAPRDRRTVARAEGWIWPQPPAEGGWWVQAVVSLPAMAVCPPPQPLTVSPPVVLPPPAPSPALPAGLGTPVPWPKAVCVSPAPPSPFGSLAGVAVHVGGAFLCPPSLPSPFPAASPEISRDKLGRAGTELLAAFRGEDGGCCCPALGPAAPWGAALSPRPGAPPGPP